MAKRTQEQGLLSNRQKTWIWILLATGIVVALLYWEQIALLYVLATVAMTVLMLVVALADLSGAHKAVAVTNAGNAPAPREIPTNEGTPATQSTFGARKSKRRR